MAIWEAWASLGFDATYHLAGVTLYAIWLTAVFNGMGFLMAAFVPELDEVGGMEMFKAFTAAAWFVAPILWLFEGGVV